MSGRWFAGDCFVVFGSICGGYPLCKPLSKNDLRMTGARSPQRCEVTAVANNSLTACLLSTYGKEIGANRAETATTAPPNLTGFENDT